MNITTSAWGGCIVGLLLAVFAVPAVARHLSRLDGDPWTFRVVTASGALKLACAPIYIYIVDHYYNGIADYHQYSNVGLQVAEQLRNGIFSFHVKGTTTGDKATSIFTGFVYLVTGSNTIGAFFVFAFIAFVSLVLFYRAFRVALPNADRRRYALLLFFLPDLLFWTSAIGKDALTSLGLAIAALGGARIYTHVKGGFPLLGLGLAFTAWIRPNLALMLFLALAIAYPFAKAKRPSAFTPVAKVAQIALLVVGGLVLAKVTAHFFHLQGGLSLHSVQHELQKNAIDTGAGAGPQGSTVPTSTSLSPLAIPKDFYYVMVRPLPFKAHGLTQLVGSLDNLLIVGIIATSWRRLGSMFRSMRRNPYLIAALVFSVVWIVLFASIGNLGILARERTSMVPLLLVIVSWPATRRQPASLPEHGGEEPEGAVLVAAHGP